jgi:hypothetical protein
VTIYVCVILYIHYLAIYSWTIEQFDRDIVLLLVWYLVLDHSTVIFQKEKKGGVHIYSRAPTTFKLEGEVTSLSESSQGEVGDNKEQWGDFWEKLIAINRNILSRPL